MNIQLNTPVRCFYLWILFCLICPVSLQANTFESLFMPGELSKAHAKFEKKCEQCHGTFEKKRQDKLCLNCHDHKDVANDVGQGKGFHGRINKTGAATCKQCHREHEGRNSAIISLNKGAFNHKLTDYPLKGRHISVACQSCHLPKKKYREAPGKCHDCHKKIDVHKGKLGKKCETCHVESSWRKSGFDHEKDTRFPLKGKHVRAACILCHADNHYKDTPRECHQCHSLKDTHNGRYGKKCISCHTSKDWNETIFKHERDTKYSLTGKHKIIKCDTCHTGNIYKQKLKKTCFSCHKNDDIHKSSNGNKCNDCHSSNSWQKSKFDHDTKTKFSLNGKHAQVKCSQCHKGKNRNKTDSACIACHKHKDVHRNQMGKQCDSCHNSAGWNNKVFFEHDITAFPLIGIHSVTSCEECHRSAAFKDVSLKCYDCHKIADKHKGRFGKKCEQCHNPNSWQVWLFDHNKQTDFTLKGAHKELHCDNCHLQSMSENLKISGTCAGCHSADDTHRGQFGRRCQRCHNETDFSQVSVSR